MGFSTAGFFSLEDGSLCNITAVSHFLSTTYANMLLCCAYFLCVEDLKSDVLITTPIRAISEIITILTTVRIRS